jgi:tripeptidyl-peptidase-2
LKVENVERFAIGHGLLQVQSAYEKLLLQNELNSADIHIHYSVTNSNTKGHGIYLRESEETRKQYQTNIFIEPLFLENVTNEMKIHFEKKILLKSDVGWIRHAEHMFLMNGGKYLALLINFAKLSFRKII